MKQHVYLIFFGSEEKQGQVYPSIIEFESQEQYDAWLEKGGEKYMEDWARTNADLYGGWPTWHVISPGDNENPDVVLANWIWDREDREPD
jgi:hypothetical protein